MPGHHKGCIYQSDTIKMLFKRKRMTIMLIVGCMLYAFHWSRTVKKTGNVRFYPYCSNRKITCAGSLAFDRNSVKIFYKLLTWKTKIKNLPFRLQLHKQCNGRENAIITQMNTPIESKLICDGQNSTSIKVTPEIFNTFVKRNFFSNERLKTCAVVGNGGILAHSKCGKMIDSAQFVFRCNLPPLSRKYRKQVGTKTNLVTANPSIFRLKYRALTKNKKKFVEDLRVYGRSLLFISAFSFVNSAEISLRAFHTIKNFNSSIRPIFMNPAYLAALHLFWTNQGLKPTRLSSGMMMVSLAVELCEEVHVYGFWPFTFHPSGRCLLPNHYYDDRQTPKNIHAMPAEFMRLVQLNNQGVLRLHLDDCKP